MKPEPGTQRVVLRKDRMQGKRYVEKRYLMFQGSLRKSALRRVLGTYTRFLIILSVFLTITYIIHLAVQWVDRRWPCALMPDWVIIRSVVGPGHADGKLERERIVCRSGRAIERRRLPATVTTP